MKLFAKKLVENHAPRLASHLRAIKNRRYFHRTFAEHNATIRRALFPSGAISVQTGPFRGMRYFDETVWGSITPKWLGSYEAELHPVIAEIVTRGYAALVDVGCAEGYYAVGLAFAIPKMKVKAFDTDFISRRQVRRLAVLNGVEDRLEVGGFCDAATLERSCQGDALLLCDIEGFERELLDPEKSPALGHTDILVEVHESSESSRDMEHLLESRFGKTHRVERLIAADRAQWISEEGAALSARLSPDQLREATAEHRQTGRLWLWMKAHRAV